MVKLNVFSKIHIIASLLAILATCAISQVPHISTLKEHGYLEKNLIENLNICEESVTATMFTAKHQTSL